MDTFGKTGIKSVVIEEIRDLAKKYGLEQVILFGSRARSDYGRASDIDLAVRGGNVLEFALDVEECTSTLLMYDVVDLGKALARELLDSIEREGIMIYEKI